MILAQLSEDLKILDFYNDIFEEEGSEIYIKPVDLYFETLPFEASFADIMALANKRDEICLGLRLGKLSKNPDKNFGVILNPPKDRNYQITKDDFLIVLSEDEL